MICWMRARQKSIPDFLRYSGWLVLLPLLTGCSELDYYLKTTTGHFDLMSGRKEISSILADPSQPEALRNKLATLLQIRTYGIDAMGLPDNGSYLQYKDLHRPNAQWVLFATPNDSMEPLAACFFVVGCVNYRVFFSESQANAAAAKLPGEVDFYVGTSPAYSTLGWFKDPVLNTMIDWTDEQTAEYLFHELAHQLYYIQNDSAFNESFAVAVEQLGVRQWLRAAGREEALVKFEQRLAIQNQFHGWIRTAVGQLKTVYGKTNLTDEEKAQQKAEILAQLQGTYQLESKKWKKPYYRKWFSQKLNNAHLLAVGTYSDYVPAFLNLYEQNQRSWLAFFAAVKQIGVLPAQERKARLDQLVGARSSP